MTYITHVKISHLIYNTKNTSYAISYKTAGIKFNTIWHTFKSQITFTTQKKT